MMCNPSGFTILVATILIGLAVSVLVAMYLDGWFESWRIDARKGPANSFDMKVMHETGLSWYAVCKARHYGTLPKVKRF